MLGNSGLAYLGTEAANAWQALDAHLTTAVPAMKADISIGARAIRAKEVAARQAIGPRLPLRVDVRIWVGLRRHSAPWSPGSRSADNGPGDTLRWHADRRFPGRHRVRRARHRPEVAGRPWAPLPCGTGVCRRFGATCDTCRATVIACLCAQHLTLAEWKPRPANRMRAKSKNR